MKHFRFYSKSDILSLTRVRKFETRAGERILSLPNGADWPEGLQRSAARFVLIGIPEDIGVKGNLGIGGADTCWHPFLDAFLNIQNNSFFNSEDVLLLGHFDFGDMKYLIENSDYNQDEMIDAYRHAVNIIDDEVENLVKVVAAQGKVPVLIGGGHNNAYPIIKGVSKGLRKLGKIPLAQVNCINLDAHADFKFTEGRHSGNAFRYAEQDGYLGKYFAIGVHENYIQQNVLMDIAENPFVQFISYEDIFIREKLNFFQAISHAIGFTEDTFTGIELDLDVIENAVSSAVAPTGINALEARRFLHFTATDAKVAYLHICEGACQLTNGVKGPNTGKLISYLVTDFFKAMTE